MSRRAVRSWLTGSVFPACQITAKDGSTVVPAFQAVWGWEPMDVPGDDMVAILGMTAHETRGTLASKKGKYIKHTVTCWVMTMDADEEYIAEHLDDMVQALQYQLRTQIATAGGIILLNDTLAVPAEESALVAVGEEIPIVDNWTGLSDVEGQEGLKQSNVIVQAMVTEFVI